MRPIPIAAGIIAIAGLSACSSSSKPVPALTSNALPVMERVALGANRCWFKSKDPMFAAYKLAPELNSFSGTPRILLVKAHSPESRPLLVVQASGSPAQLQSFGPLMADPSVSARVSGDVRRWANGGESCG